MLRRLGLESPLLLNDTPPRFVSVVRCLNTTTPDALVLTSPTTTERDNQAAERLGRWAFIRGGPLVGETIGDFGERVAHIWRTICGMIIYA